MEQKARMTFRFEPPKKADPTPIERKRITKTQSHPEKLEDRLPDEPAVTKTSHVLTAWDAPYQDDIHALEEIIRRSEPVAVDLKEEDRPITEVSEEKWSLPEGPEIETYPGWLSSGLTRREGPSWWRVFLSVSAAVATGALFGYMVLTLFTGEPLFPGKSSGGKDTPLQKAVEAAGGGALPTLSNPSQDAAASSGSDGQKTLAEVPGDVYYMLQYGVFRSEDSMKAAVQELKGKGLASAMDTSDGYRVYAGAAGTRDEAELLAVQLEGTELYIKPLEADPLVVSSAQLPERLPGFMNASAELIRSLTQYTVIALQDRLPQALSDEDVSSLKQTHRKWLDMISAVEGLAGAAKDSGKEVVQALNSAVLSMNEYNRKPARYHLWSAQTAIMKALVADREMRIALQPTSE